MKPGTVFWIVYGVVVTALLAVITASALMGLSMPSKSDVVILIAAILIPLYAELRKKNRKKKH